MQLPPARAPPSAPTSQALAGFTRIETTGVGAFGLRPLYCPWPRFVDTPPWRGPSHCALCALRRTSGGATMTIPGGAGTTHPPVLGAPASLIGSELSVYLAPPQCYAAIIDAPLLGKRKGAGVHYCEAPALPRALNRPATRCYRSGCRGSFATANDAPLLVYAATGCRRSATWPYRGGAKRFLMYAPT